HRRRRARDRPRRLPAPARPERGEVVREGGRPGPEVRLALLDRGTRAVRPAHPRPRPGNGAHLRDREQPLPRQGPGERARAEGGPRRGTRRGSAGARARLSSSGRDQRGGRRVTSMHVQIVSKEVADGVRDLLEADGFRMGSAPYAEWEAVGSDVRATFYGKRRKLLFQGPGTRGL